jgi:hypothetical protein
LLQGGRSTFRGWKFGSLIGCPFSSPGVGGQLECIHISRTT